MTKTVAVVGGGWAGIAAAVTAIQRGQRVSLIEMAGHLGGRPTSQLVHLAALHGYTTVFWWCAAILAAGAVISGLLLRSGLLPEPEATPAQSPSRQTAPELS